MIFDKNKLIGILQHVATQDRTVLEFKAIGSPDDGKDREYTVADITNHVEVLEEAYDQDEAFSPATEID